MAYEVPARMFQSPVVAKRPRALLPVVQRMSQQLNTLFLEFTGNAGADLIDPLFEQWMHNGRIGPSGLRVYAMTLSEQLDDALEREHFNRLAEKILNTFSDVVI